MATKKKTTRKRAKPQPKSLTGKKKRLMEALVRSLGNVTASAEAAGVHRCMHYEWLEKDPLYRREFETINERQADFYEQALNKLVKEGHPTAIIFALKCKGKSRGWVERQEIEHTGNAPINISLVERSVDEIKDAKN